MRIYAYKLPNNESFYFDYAIKGLRQNGHTVIERDKNRFLSLKEEAELIEDLGIDLVYFQGFAFVSLITAFEYELLERIDAPFLVYFYDNPFRYLHRLSEVKDFDYHFFCCDSKLTEMMVKEGYNCRYLPCCFDPEIQYPRPHKEPFICDIGFAGSVFSEESIVKRRKPLHESQVKILDSMQRTAMPGKYYDYVNGLRGRGVNPRSNVFEPLAFCNLMEQKHWLRMQLFDALPSNLQTHIFGQGDWQSERKNIKRFPHNLHQHYELPYFYSAAKINTSIELLPASVHQRVFEVAGCGGFIILEDKADNNECFEVYDRWKSLEELTEKLTYYSSQEGRYDRERIAKCMREEAMEKHTCKIRMEEVINSIS